MGQAQTRVQLAGQSVTVPTLSGPVGAPTPAYPTINQAAANAQVDAQFALIAELRNAPAGTGGKTPQFLEMAQAVANYRADRVGAIAGFQRTANAGTAAERAGPIILPNGATWQALFEYGRMASDLDTLRDRRRNPRDYIYTGRFDHARFAKETAARLKANAITRERFFTGSLPNFDRMLTYMERDARIIDIRWMAYMFGTAFYEGSVTIVTGRRPNGSAIKQWRTVTPISEDKLGKSKLYGRPVKVERLGDTRARITEWDGDQVEITDGKYILRRSQDGGAPYKSLASAVYKNVTGVEKTYYGRGYVQLTWWYHYAAASVAIGRNYDLLWDPELANDPDIAYKVMADGMITGRHFANGERLQKYISGNLTNYAGARAIVNRADQRPEIVAAAKAFEPALLASRL